MAQFGQYCRDLNFVASAVLRSSWLPAIIIGAAFSELSLSALGQGDLYVSTRVLMQSCIYGIGVALVTLFLYARLLWRYLAAVPQGQRFLCWERALQFLSIDRVTRTPAFNCGAYLYISVATAVVVEIFVFLCFAVLSIESIRSQGHFPIGDSASFGTELLRTRLGAFFVAFAVVADLISIWKRVRSRRVIALLATMVAASLLISGISGQSKCPVGMDVHRFFLDDAFVPPGKAGHVRLSWTATTERSPGRTRRASSLN
jgi:hypothetical protein